MADEPKTIDPSAQARAQAVERARHLSESLAEAAKYIKDDKLDSARLIEIVDRLWVMLSEAERETEQRKLFTDWVEFALQAQAIQNAPRMTAADTADRALEAFASSAPVSVVRRARANKHLVVRIIEAALTNRGGRGNRAQETRAQAIERFCQAMGWKGDPATVKQGRRRARRRGEAKKG